MMSASRNIFSIGRRAGAEDQLTEMLVWLASVVPEFATRVVGLGLGDVDIEGQQVEATTQYGIAHGRLDALFSTPSAVLVVESKLKSGYGDGQLGKYLDWLAEQHSESPRRGLMTLTELHAPWLPEDLNKATALGIVPTARRWHELHDVVAAMADEVDRDELSSRVLQDFADMLAEEGLVPVKPLVGDELIHTWSNAEAVIRRYHDFFRACRDALSEALGATPHPNRSSSTQTYVYHDFKTQEDELIGVGLWCSDRDWSTPAHAKRNAVVAWLTIEAATWPDWPAAKKHLADNPPGSWRQEPNGWYGRPTVWHYLDEVVGEGAFEEQRLRFAEACGEARGWLDAARAAQPAPKRGVFRGR
jgi:hypothetical protein